jgi:dihydroorotate dehydrogenase
MNEYASEAETDALIVKDTRTDNMKMLDKVLDERGANEQGVDSYPILYQIALELIENARGEA